MEYSCELWDGCTEADSDKLEKIQYQAARIVTGLPLFASIDSLLSETGWESLKSRRERRKLSLFYKIQNDLTPSYLKNMLPQQVNQLNPYELRNNSNYRAPQLRLQSSLDSFLPSTLRLWNSLDEDTRTKSSLKQFKCSLQNSYDVFKPPK